MKDNVGSSNSDHKTLDKRTFKYKYGLAVEKKRGAFYNLERSSQKMKEKQENKKMTDFIFKCNR